MLYSQEFFQEVQSRLKPGGFFVQWDVASGAQQTMQSVFPYVMRVGMAGNLWVLIGSEQPVTFNKELLIERLQQPQVVNFLKQAGFDLDRMRQDVKQAHVQMFSSKNDNKPEPFNTDLFPRGEYYLNRR